MARSLQPADTQVNGLPHVGSHLGDVSASSYRVGAGEVPTESTGVLSVDEAATPVAPPSHEP
jgi:hypothetical protein